jgi:hypothetical protein
MGDMNEVEVIEPPARRRPPRTLRGTPAAPVERTRCSVCKSEYKPQIHALRASGMLLADIHAATQKMGRGFKRETLGKHFRICLGGAQPEVLAQEIADASKEAKTQAEIDFATLVQKRAAQMLAAGELRVTASHGLQAQALLDRRAEKQADRDLAVNMARLLSGAMVMAPSEVIEGRVLNVTPSLLAPSSVVEP